MSRPILFLILLSGTAAQAQDMPLSQILIDGESWRAVSEWFPTLPNEAKALHATVRGPEKCLYGCDLAMKRVVKIDAERKLTVIAEDIAAEDIAVTSKGVIYCTSPGSKVVIRIADGKKTVVATGEAYRSLVLWPDEGTLVVGPTEGQHLWAFRVEKDGSLAHGDAYYPLRVPSGKNLVNVRGMTVDMAGRLYAATDLGIQVFDPTGRQSGVLVAPSPQSPAPSLLGFGGEKGDELFVAWGDKLYSRKTRAKGLSFPR